jgi:hypothetical protein
MGRCYTEFMVELRISKESFGNFTLFFETGTRLNVQNGWVHAPRIAIN